MLARSLDVKGRAISPEPAFALVLLAGWSCRLFKQPDPALEPERQEAVILARGLQAPPRRIQVDLSIAPIRTAGDPLSAMVGSGTLGRGAGRVVVGDLLRVA